MPWVGDNAAVMFNHAKDNTGTRPSPFGAVPLGRILGWRRDADKIYIRAGIARGSALIDSLWSKVIQPAGNAGGFSIGGAILQRFCDSEGRNCYVSKIDVVEVSWTPNPANPGAKVDVVSTAKGTFDYSGCAEAAAKLTDDQRQGMTPDEFCKAVAEDAMLEGRPELRSAARAMHLVQRPFAGYTDFDDCVKRNQGKSDPKAYCGEIMHAVEKADIELLEEAEVFALFTPPEAGDLGAEDRRKLAKVYSECRQRWVNSHPKDRENSANKTSCAKQAWAVVNGSAERSQVLSAAAPALMPWMEGPPQDLEQLGAHLTGVVTSYTASLGDRSTAAWWVAHCPSCQTFVEAKQAAGATPDEALEDLQRFIDRGIEDARKATTMSPGPQTPAPAPAPAPAAPAPAPAAPAPAPAAPAPTTRQEPPAGGPSDDETKKKKEQEGYEKMAKALDTVIKMGGQLEDLAQRMAALEGRVAKMDGDEEDSEKKKKQAAAPAPAAPAPAAPSPAPGPATAKALTFANEEEAVKFLVQRGRLQASGSTPTPSPSAPGAPGGAEAPTPTDPDAQRLAAGFTKMIEEL